MASVGKVIREMLNESHQGRSGESRMQGGMIAKVVDNVDPEDRYRVRVSFPWLSDQYAKDTTSDGSESKVQSHWARITSLMTGGDMGGVWLPEIDDEVMVVFEEGDFGRPIVVGSLWNGEKSSPRKLTYSPDQTEVDVPNNQQGGENNFRFFRSRMGHSLAFVDKEGNGGVSIRSAKSAELYIDDADGSERIRLYDKDQKQWLEIDTVNKKITLETDTGDILIKAKELIRMECKNFELEAEKNVSIKAGKNLDMKCNKLNSKSDASTDITASAKMTLKGATIDLNP